MAWENTNEAAWLKGEEAERGCGGGIQRVAIRTNGKKGGVIGSKSGLPAAVPEGDLSIVLCIGS